MTAAGAVARRRKVLFVLPTLNLAGAQKVVVELVRGLDRSRFEPAVCCLLGFGHFEAELRQQGVELVQLAPAGLKDLRFPLRFARLLRSRQVDLVASNFHLFDLWVAAGARLARVPCVVTKHDTYLLDPLPRPVLAAVERATQRLSTAYLAVSQAVADYLVEDRGVDPRRVQVIHNGVDGAPCAAARAGRAAVRAELGYGPEDLVVGTVANLHRRKKGYEVLVEALPELLVRVPRARFLWVGGDVGGFRAELEQRLRELGAAGRVRLVGARDDVPALLAAMDLFVLPSTFEGLGIVLVEAMASGLPVVASDVGGIPEVVLAGETGVLVPVGDREALCRAICDVLTDPELARRLGRAGLERAHREFGLARMVAAYSEVFDACA